MLLIEAAVLLLIAWEIGRIFGVSEGSLSVKYRIRFCAEGTEVTSAFSSGDVWAGRATRPQFTPAWINLVKTWNQEVVNFMETCSPQARWSFLNDTSDGAAHAHQALGVPPEAQWWYRTMLTRLDNLQKIAENPDVYF